MKYTMKSAIERILSDLKLLTTFTESSDFYVKLENSPYMPLCIEKHGKRVTVTHYFESNGDLIPDPDMEFMIANDQFEPLAIQHGIGIYRRTFTPDGLGNFIRNEREFRSQLYFSKIWATNLIHQGFGSATIASKDW